MIKERINVFIMTSFKGCLNEIYCCAILSPLTELYWFTLETIFIFPDQSMIRPIIIKAPDMKNHKYEPNVFQVPSLIIILRAKELKINKPHPIYRKTLPSIDI